MFGERRQAFEGMPMTDDILKEAREAFELAAEREAENRAEALDDLRFSRLGEQWPAEIRKKRQDDCSQESVSANARLNQ